jgi:hypothetical protein
VESVQDKRAGERIDWLTTETTTRKPAGLNHDRDVGAKEAPNPFAFLKLDGRDETDVLIKNLNIFFFLV